MENSTPFDLDQALSQWLGSLQNLGGIRPEELEELECHLRESISTLHARGLSIHEAFTIATRRLGSERQLADEFAKANPQRVWTERAMWMVTGVLGALALHSVTAPIVNSVVSCALWSGVNSHLVGALQLVAGWILLFGAAATIFWFSSRHFSQLDRAVQACTQRPLLAGLGLFIGLECLQHGMWRVNRFIEPVYIYFTGHFGAAHPNAGAEMALWALWGGLITQLLWIAAGPLLAGYAWRVRGKPASELPVLHALQPGEQAAASALQGQGFSLDEATFLLAWRRRPQDCVASSRVPATAKGIWLERAAWMVAGVALSQCLELLVVNLGWLLAIATRPVAPLGQHLAGLGSACLGLTLGGTIIAGLWWWVTRHPGQSASIGKVCRFRPLVAALALVALCSGIGFCEYALVMGLKHLNLLPANNSIGPIVAQYLTYSSAVTHLIIPIALLLWSARRWRRIQTNPAPCR